MPKSPLQLSRDKIQNICDYLDQEDHRAIKNCFLEKFFLCEIVYKELLKYYFKSKNRKYREDDLKLSMYWIPKVISHFNISIDMQSLKAIFSTANEFKKRGAKSARILRNGIVHNLNIQDIGEVVDKHEYLFQILDIFLSKIEEAAALIDTTEVKKNSTEEHTAEEKLLAIG